MWLALMTWVLLLITTEAYTLLSPVSNFNLRQGLQCYGCVEDVVSREPKVAEEVRGFGVVVDPLTILS